MVPSNEKAAVCIVSNAEKVTLDEQRNYLRKVQNRYPRADLKKRSRLLDHLGQILGFVLMTFCQFLKEIS